MTFEWTAEQEDSLAWAEADADKSECYADICRWLRASLAELQRRDERDRIIERAKSVNADPVTALMRHELSKRGRVVRNGWEMNAAVPAPAAGPTDAVRRCTRCGWPLAKSREDGCVEGDCSMRNIPEPATTSTSPGPTDAELLDWLERELFDRHWDGCLNHPSTWHMAGPYRHTLQKMRGATLREAIATALQAKR